MKHHAPVASNHSKGQAKGKSTRKRLLGLASALVFFSVFIVGLSLYQIVSLGSALQSMREVDLPLGRLLAQLDSDTGLMVKELEKRLGFERWGDQRFRPQTLPRWLEELVGSQVRRLTEVRNNEDFTKTLQVLWPRWPEWGAQAGPLFEDLVRSTRELYDSITSTQPGDESRARDLYSPWRVKLQGWSEYVQNGLRESQEVSQRSFALAETKLSDLKTVLKATLLMILLLSTGLIALSDRALRPLGILTEWIEELTRKGLQTGSDPRLTAVAARKDETGALAQAFSGLTRSLLEREVTVEEQQRRLEEQNRKLGEMVELQKRLSWAENLAALGKLSAQVAHEVRNPLHSIGLETEVALSELEACRNSAVQSSLHSILTSVERLEKITQNYLQFARLGSGVLVDVSLSEILERVISTYQPDADAYRVTVECVKATGPAGSGDAQSDRGSSDHVRADRDLLEGALSNLHKNALQAVRGLPQGSARRIRWTLWMNESGRLALRVEDSGPGIPPEIRGKIFDPFVTTKASGTGLGLSIVQMGMEKMGGRVELAESAFGGAAFVLIFDGTLVQHSSVVKNTHGENSLS